MIKRFRCTTLAWTLILNAVNTLNAEKIGRNRRGTLVLRKVEWTVECVGTSLFYDMALEWERSKAMNFIYFNGMRLGRVSTYKYNNHKKLLKVLKQHG